MAKKSKPKLNFGEGDGHNFFAKHVEKLILVAVALLIGFFVYSGMSIEGLDDTKTPDKLSTQANQARTRLDQTEWEVVKDEEDRHAYDLIDRLAGRTGLLPATDPTLYQTMVTWEPPAFSRKGKRADPKLFAPEKLEVEPGYGPVAGMGSLAEDALLAAAREAQQAFLAEAPKKKQPSKRSADSPYDPMTLSSLEYGASTPMGDAGGLLGGMSSTANTGPKATPEQLQYFSSLGFRPNSSGSSYGGDLGGGSSLLTSTTGATGGATGTVAKGRYFMAIKALVPYKQQWGEFQSTFEDAFDYNPARDIPQYYWYRVERVEVNDQGDVVSQLREPYTPPTAQWFRQRYYAGIADHGVDPKYFDRLLTSPVPPLMMRDLEKYQLHSETPKRQIVMRQPERKQQADDAVPPTGGIGEGLGPTTRSPYGANPMGGMADNAMASQRAGSADSGAVYGEAGYGEEGYGETGYGGTGFGATTGGMMGEGATRGVPTPPTVDYKLFRFFDFMVEPGKKYKYRVQLFLLDPNHPYDPRMAPPVAYLEDAVLKRIRGIDDQDVKTSQSSGRPTRTFWVETEWSEWSDVVSIPPQYEVLAGPVTPGRRSLNRDKGVEIPEPGSEPEGQAMAIVWDPVKAADIPGVQSVYRGSMLNFQTDPAVMHPVNLQVLKLNDYPIKTDCLVLDVKGGQPLPTNDRANIQHKSPGEFLLMDANGNLVVRNELDDVPEFRNHHFTEPEPVKEPAADEGTGIPGYDPMTTGGDTGRGRRPPRGAP